MHTVHHTHSPETVILKGVKHNILVCSWIKQNRISRLCSWNVKCSVPLLIWFSFKHTFLAAQSFAILTITHLKLLFTLKLSYPHLQFVGDANCIFICVDWVWINQLIANPPPRESELTGRTIDFLIARPPSRLQDDLNVDPQFSSTNAPTLTNPKEI